MSRRGTYGLFAVMAALYLIHFVVERAGMRIPLVHAYMDDLFCLPLVLFPLLLLFRLKQGHTYTFPLGYVMATWVAMSLLFEIWIPARNPNFTADPLDILMYGLGGALFAYMQQPFARDTQDAVGSERAR